MAETIRPEGEPDEHESHWHRLVEWFGHEFGAAHEEDDPKGLVIVFEGSPDACRLAALRLKSAGVFVLPDPTSTINNRPGHDVFSIYGVGNRVPQRVVGIAVRRPDVERAHEILDDVEPI